MKVFTLSQMKDKFIGKKGNKNRDSYEYTLQMELLGKMIRKARLERHLTQEELGKLIGVGKSQVSKLERSANSATIDTVLRVFNALEAELNFSVKLENKYLSLA
ncbi:MAG: helix-turn-helix domain-containing protein [Cyclobacteriaceae bacterium]|nr:helix-turn-helix domain-containing protein [Cyclobacteriaceae bacterium]